MVSLDPVWSRSVKISEKAMDPLGLNRVSDRITNEMVTGITSMTQRARYYSFYTWAIYTVNKKPGITRFQEFAKLFYDLERAFMMACIAHRESSKDNSMDHSGILGSDIGKNFWHENKNEIDMSFRFLANRLGGYGYYYQASLFYLGLTIRDAIKDSVTELGEKLALAFEQSIRDTTYFKKYVWKERIPKKILLEYGKKCCLCMLKNNVQEKELLKKILFGLDCSSKDIELSKKRRDTLLLILHFVNQAYKHGFELSEENFLNGVYYGQMAKESIIVDVQIPSFFNDVAYRWKMFRSHDFFSYACEGLFSAFIKMLEKHFHTGLTFEQFLNAIDAKRTVDLLSTLLNTHFDASNLHEVMVRDIIKNVNKIVLGNDADVITDFLSENFDRKCDLKSSVNEYRLAKSVNKEFASDIFDLQKVVVHCLLLLLVLYTRFYHYWKKKNLYWKWLSGHTGRDISPFRFIIDFERKMNGKDLTLYEFLAWFFKEYIIEQANRISIEKCQNIIVSRPVFWFHKEGMAYVKDRDYSPRFRNSRFNSCYMILRDLGLIESVNGLVRLTTDGTKMLQLATEGETRNGI
jgi:hypothetical protein